MIGKNIENMSNNRNEQKEIILTIVEDKLLTWWYKLKDYIYAYKQTHIWLRKRI